MKLVCNISFWHDIMVFICPPRCLPCQNLLEYSTSGHQERNHFMLLNTDKEKANIFQVCYLAMKSTAKIKYCQWQMKEWVWILTGQNPCSQRRNHPSATLSTINFIWCGLRFNTGLCSRCPMANWLIHDMVTYGTHQHARKLDIRKQRQNHANQFRQAHNDIHALFALCH